MSGATVWRGPAKAVETQNKLYPSGGLSLEADVRSNRPNVRFGSGEDITVDAVREIWLKNYHERSPHIRRTEIWLF